MVGMIFPCSRIVQWTFGLLVRVKIPVRMLRRVTKTQDCVYTQPEVQYNGVKEHDRWVVRGAQ
jgi:hypothetical protein